MQGTHNNNNKGQNTPSNQIRGKGLKNMGYELRIKVKGFRVKGYALRVMR